MPSEPGTLRQLHGSVPADACTSALVVVPGIGTPSAQLWKSGGTDSIWPHQISRKLGSTITYFAWWDHGLTDSKLLSWDSLSRSAHRLLHALLSVISSAKFKPCPVILIGHSLGGILIKETLRSWYQRPEHARTASNSAAGVILLGTPHTVNSRNAVQFCKLISLAFLGKTLQPGDPGMAYASELVRLCEDFEDLDVPTFSIHELLKTRLGPLKNVVLVDHVLALIGTPQEQAPWGVKCSHRDLCYGKKFSPMLLNALEKFVVDMIEEKRAYNDDFSRRRPTLFLTSSRPTLRSSNSSEVRPTIRSSDSSDFYWPAGGLHHSPTSITASLVAGLTMREGFEEARSPPASGPSDTLKPRPEYNIPPKLSSFFARDKIQKSLEAVLLRSNARQEALYTSEHIRTFALCGGGGIGKTSIATNFVHTHKNLYDAVFWVNANSVTTLFYAYTEIAFLLNLQDRSKPHDMVECQRRVRVWLCSWNRPDASSRENIPWLIVFDHVTNPEDLREFWPNEGGGDILITTRCSLLDTNEFFGQLGVEVEPFDKHVALDFLRGLTNEQLNEPDQLIKATEIAEMLGGSPLALVSLSRLINQGYLGQDGVETFTRRRISLSESTQPRLDFPGATIDPVVSVVFPLLDKLRYGGTLIEVLSLLDSDVIDEWILTKAPSSLELEGFPQSANAYSRARAELMASSLISEGNRNNQVFVHRMIQDAVKRKMTLERLQEVFEATVRLFSMLWPDMAISQRHNVQRWGDVDLLLRHVRQLHQIHESSVELMLSLQASITFAKVLNDAAWCMYERGDYENANDLGHQAFVIAEDLKYNDATVESFEVEDIRSNIYYTLGAIAQITHIHQESLDMHEKLLKLRKSLRLKPQLSRGDPLLAHAYNELGNDYTTTSEYHIAIGYYKTSIETYLSLKDFEKSMLVLPSVNLGLAYWLQGNYGQAAATVHDALQDRERDRQFGIDDKQSMKTGRLLFAMGNITYSQGLFEKSFEFHYRAWKQFESTLGNSHNRTCDVKYRMADHYARKGDYKAALLFLDQALQVVMYRPLFEREKARIIFKKGCVLKACGELSSSDQHFDWASSIYADLCGGIRSSRDLTENDFDELVMFWSR